MPLPIIVNEESHEALASLVHGFGAGFLELERDTDGLIQAAVLWTDSGKTQKVREVTLTRTNGALSQAVVKRYDQDGVLVGTLTKDIARDAQGRVVSITIVKT